MVEITNKVIKFTRGDTVKIKLNLQNADGTQYKMQVGDSIECNLKSNPDTYGASIYSRLSFPDDEILLTSDDTSFFPPGKHYIEIRLVTKNKEVYTIFGLRSETDHNLIIYPNIEVGAV